MKINKIPFSDLQSANLTIDTVYEGGTSGNSGDEVLSKLLRVGNAGGFRKCNARNKNGARTGELAYVCIYTSGEEIEWCDTIDRTLGRFTYYGDNRTAGNPITKTKAGGNSFLQTIYSNLALGLRKQIPPVFVFQKYCGRDMIFLGLAVLDHPTDRLHQVNVVGEFSGTDRADPGQQPGHHMIAIDVHHVSHLSGVGHHGRQLKIDECLVIAEDDVGQLQPFHINGLQGVLFADETDLGQDPNHPSEPGRLTDGIFSGFIGFFPLVIYFHF